jgi:hypothetical protein
MKSKAQTFPYKMIKAFGHEERNLKCNMITNHFFKKYFIKKIILNIKI